MSTKMDNSPTVLTRIKSYMQISRSVENLRSAVRRSRSFQYFSRKEDLTEADSSNSPNDSNSKSPRSDLRRNPRPSIKQSRTTRQTKCQSSIIDNHSHFYSDVKLPPTRQYLGSSYQKLQETSDYLIPQENFAKYIDISNRIYKVPSNVPRLDHPDADKSPDVPIKTNAVRKIPVGKCFSEPLRSSSYKMENEDQCYISRPRFNRLSIGSDREIKEMDDNSDADSDEHDLSSDFPSTIEPPTLAYKNRLIQLINDTKSKSRSVHDISELNYREKSNCLSKCVSEKILSLDTLERHQELKKAFKPLPISKLCYSDSSVLLEENSCMSKLNYQEKSGCLSRNISDKQSCSKIQRGQGSNKSRLSSRDECYIEVNFPGREGSFDDAKKSYCHKTSFETKHAESYVKLVLN